MSGDGRADTPVIRIAAALIEDDRGRLLLVRKAGTNAFMQADVQSHSNIMTKDDFRTAVQKIRDRIDRERQEKMAQRRKDPPSG